MKRTFTRKFAVIGAAAALGLGAAACDMDEAEEVFDDNGEVETPDEGETGPDLEEAEPEPGPEEVEELDDDA